MHFTGVLTSVFAVVVLATANPEPAPYKLGMMSVRDLFGLNKRQSAGYAPSQTFCDGPGTTCDTVCGAGQQQCASSDDVLHCFDPTQKQTCCPDLTGNACADGYYCTEDSTGNTWCCPDGLDTAACAAAFSVTGGLSSLAPATSAPATGSASASAAPVTAAATTPTPIASATEVSNLTVTTASVVQFTGAANTKAVYGGVAGVILGVAGLVAAL